MESTAIIGLGRQNVLRRQMTVIANNIANMNTHGYKGEKMMFIEHVHRSKGGERLLGDKIHHTHDFATVRDMREGPLEPTGNPLDLGIQGEGYFVVQTDKGDLYTRNGRFQLNNEGTIVTQHGHPVMSEGGQPFTITPGEHRMEISRDGTLSVNDVTLGKFKFVQFDGRPKFEHQSGGLLKTEAPATDVESPTVIQGMLEGSNVEPILEITRMIQVNRSYNSAKKLIEKEDDRIKKMIDAHIK